jgi:chorismate synthase
MPGNTFGKYFRITTFGESHGPAIGVVIDGCPAGLPLDPKKIATELARRRPGQSRISSPRAESDQADILSGYFDGQTTGAPITLLIPSRDQRPADYDALKDVFRPSHADFTTMARYGIRDHRGGGRSSARETAARVAAGAVAKQFLDLHNIHIRAWVCKIYDLEYPDIPSEAAFREGDLHPVRCPDPVLASKMEARIIEAREAGDSLGGVIRGWITGVPAGLGEPVFDKLQAELGKAMLSINAVKGFEIGSGFAAAGMKGSEHNDAFVKEGEQIRTQTNHSGGIQGGISNGMPIDFRLAFKPVATIGQAQQTVDIKGESVTLEAKGRHDACVVPRAVPIVEAMAALVLADQLLGFRLAKI